MAAWLAALLALLAYARRTTPTRPLATTAIAMGGALLTAALVAMLTTVLLFPDARPDAIAGLRLVLWYPVLMGDESVAAFVTWNSDPIFDVLPDLLPGIVLATTAFAVSFLACGAREPLPLPAADDPALRPGPDGGRCRASRAPSGPLWSCSALPCGLRRWGWSRHPCEQR
ncbi:hypothetical protein ACFQX7_06000 [Luedemannella flava]